VDIVNEFRKQEGGEKEKVELKRTLQPRKILKLNSQRLDVLKDPEVTQKDSKLKKESEVVEVEKVLQVCFLPKCNSVDKFGFPLCPLCHGADACL